MPLKPPLRDENDNVLPHDHEEIGPTDGVIRRVSHHFLTPGPDGNLRLSSMAFKPSSGTNGGMSVDLEQSILDAGLDVRTHVTSPQFIGSVRFTAGSLRAEKLMVGFHPIPGNDHHGEVWGTSAKSVQRRLAQLAEWFVPIEGVTLSKG